MMKKLRYGAAFCLGTLICNPVFANENIDGYIGAYIVPDAGIEMKNPGNPPIKDSGKAYGVVAELNKEHWFGYIHYETVSIDLDELPQPGVDADEYRVGLGWRQKMSKGSIQASVEYFRQKQKFDFDMVPDWKDSGIGFHVNGEYLLGVLSEKVPVAGFADMGYIDMNKSDAEEYRFGLKALVSKHIGLMTAYRVFKQEKDTTQEKTILKAMNIGVSYLF